VTPQSRSIAAEEAHRIFASAKKRAAGILPAEAASDEQGQFL
jgi:hypothetical protein